MIPNIHIKQTGPTVALFHKIMELLKLPVDPKEKKKQLAGTQTLKVMRGFRKEVPALLKSISGRLTKLEVAGISLALAKAKAWLNAEILEDMLGEALLTEHIKLGRDATTKEQQIKRCLTLPPPFIAVVKGGVTALITW